MTLKDVRSKLEEGDLAGALSALDGYELRMTSARRKGGSVKSKAKSEAAKRRWEARQGRDVGSVLAHEAREKLLDDQMEHWSTDRARLLESMLNGGAEPIASMPVKAGQVAARKDLDAISESALARLGVMKGSEMEGRGHE